jgi:hypothetical protein
MHLQYYLIASRGGYYCAYRQSRFLVVFLIRTILQFSTYLILTIFFIQVPFP